MAAQLAEWLDVVAFAWAMVASIFAAVTVQPVPALIIPIGVTALPIIYRVESHRRVIRVLALAPLLGFMAIAILSVGWFYAPSAIALGIAAWKSG